MFVERDFYIGLRDINSKLELKNTGLLSYLEDVACIHSEIAGCGMSKIHETNRTWVLLNWKVEVIKRPKFNDVLHVVTWSNKIEKIYAFRDFEVYNEANELIAKIASKWLFIDIQTGKFVKVEDNYVEQYKIENKFVFGDNTFEKLREPAEHTVKEKYQISPNMIDVNNHVHNIYYMDIVNSVLPKDIENELNKFEIMYKKEIKAEDKIIVFYNYEKETSSHIVTIKNEDEKTVHAIIKLN